MHRADARGCRQRRRTSGKNCFDAGSFLALRLRVIFCVRCRPPRRRSRNRRRQGAGDGWLAQHNLTGLALAYRRPLLSTSSGQ